MDPESWIILGWGVYSVAMLTLGIILGMALQDARINRR